MSKMKKLTIILLLFITFFSAADSFKFIKTKKKVDIEIKLFNNFNDEISIEKITTNKYKIYYADTWDQTNYYTGYLINNDVLYLFVCIDNQKNIVFINYSDDNKYVIRTDINYDYIKYNDIIKIMFSENNLLCLIEIKEI